MNPAHHELESITIITVIRLTMIVTAAAAAAVTGFIIITIVNDYHLFLGLTCLQWRSSEYQVCVSWAHGHTAWQTFHSCGLPGCNPAHQTGAWQTHPQAAPEVVISAATYTALTLFFSPRSTCWLALQPVAKLHQRL